MTVVPLVPYRRVALPLDGPPAEVISRVSDLLKGSDPLDGVVGAGSSNTHRITGRVDARGFKLAVQAPRLWRIPYLPVLIGHFGNRSLLITARPQLYELLFLPLWATFVLYDGGPLWFGLGVPLAYHCIGWGVFSVETRRMIAVLSGALTAETRG